MDFDKSLTLTTTPAFFLPMISLGGFYIDSPWDRWGAADAEDMLGEKLSEKNTRACFEVNMVPMPNSDKRPRVYLPPQETSKTDNLAKQLLEEALGLKLPDWKTIWFDQHSSDLDDIVEFVTAEN
ncbi:hypothetical protein FRC10_008044 [Ceratobasidium sp. 414]|nr:hypothetical protein FRC10_008044 [Ceratobasidium sp. 414]